MDKNKELIDNGNDENSSSGSDDCPSDDNLSKAVLKQILPATKKDKKCSNSKTRDDLQTIFGFPGKKKSVTEMKKEKPKEEKKLPPPPKVEKKIVKKPPIAKEEKKAKEEITESTAQYVDASTQTEKIDFQKARARWVMNKFGKSQGQQIRSSCNI